MMDQSEPLIEDSIYREVLALMDSTQWWCLLCPVKDSVAVAFMEFLKERLVSDDLQIYLPTVTSCPAIFLCLVRKTSFSVSDLILWLPYVIDPGEQRRAFEEGRDIYVVSTDPDATAQILLWMVTAFRTYPLLEGVSE